MRLKDIILRSSIILITGYALIVRPYGIIKPLVTVVSIVQYPFFCFYSFFIEPVVDGIACCTTHHEYHRLLASYADERSALLKKLIEVSAQLVYYKDLHDAGITDQERAHRVCRIIYKQLHQQDPFFIIDKGSYDNVAVDMVVVRNKVLLGRVTAVYPAYAQVMPTSNRRCHVPIVCADSRAHGVFHGESALLGKLDFISHLEPLLMDELVITSGDGLIYPYGLAVGRIKKFSLNELGFLYDVDVEMVYDLEKVSYCSVISKEMQQALPHTGAA